MSQLNYKEDWEESTSQDCYQRARDLIYSLHQIRMILYCWRQQFVKDSRYRDLFYMLLNNRISFEGITKDDNRINSTTDLLFEIGKLVH